MYSTIIAVVVAVLLVLLGLRMIIRALPDMLSENLIRDIESACQMSVVATPFVVPKSKQIFWQRLGIGLMLTSHTNILSRLIGREHRLEVASLSRKILKKLPQFSLEVAKPSSIVWIATRETIRSIILRAESNEGDHLYLLHQINEISVRLADAIDCTRLLDEAYAQITQSIGQLLVSGQSEIVETASVVSETSLELVRELSQNGDLNPVVFTEKIRSFNELLRLCHEIESELAGFGSKHTDDWVDYYKLLEIPSDASCAEIKSAYRRRANQFHPDRKEEELGRVSDQEIKGEIERTFNDKMVQVNLAYEALSDSKSRASYDLDYRQRKG